ncbi:MAG: DUF1080 domain-containing protein [Bacteroidetes bacterium]|nr:DUF1080 domain-containing protein [Bacteroidota bacterium]
MIKTRLFLSAITAVSLLACNNSSDSSAESKKDTSAATTATTATVSLVSPLTEQEKADGWQLLFDGTSKGWHKYHGGSIESAGWVADSTLHFDAAKAEQNKNGADIVTDDEFENFDLKLDVKIDTGGNSGVMFLVHEGEDSAKYYNTYFTGPEMQVLDNAKHPDSKIRKHRAGDLYDLIACAKEVAKPALEWNEYEIKIDSAKLNMFVNGTNVVSTTLWDDKWNKLVAGSKFKQWPEFAKAKKGRFALQDHGHNVWFRNIRVKKL